MKTVDQLKAILTAMTPEERARWVRWIRSL